MNEDKSCYCGTACERAELDALLDSIDSILEENAAEFIKNLTLGGPRKCEPDGYESDPLRAQREGPDLGPDNR